MIAILAAIFLNPPQLVLVSQNPPLPLSRKVTSGIEPQARTGEDGTGWGEPSKGREATPDLISEANPARIVSDSPLAPQDPPISYVSRDGALVLAGFANTSTFIRDILEGTFSVNGTGKPAIVEVKSSGISLSADAISASAATSEAKTYFLTKAHTSGNSIYVLDTAESQKFKESHAQDGGKPPSSSQGTLRAELDTDRTDYKGSETSGTLTFPDAFNMTSKSEGDRYVVQKKKKVHQRYSQDVKVHGASGTLDVDPRPNQGIQAVKSGLFEGPITLVSHRTETNLDDKTVTKYTLIVHCNRLRIETDPTGETAIMEDSVTVDAIDDLGTLHQTASKATFKFDLNLSPVHFDFEGPPANTVMRRKGAKP